MPYRTIGANCASAAANECCITTSTSDEQKCTQKAYTKRHSTARGCCDSVHRGGEDDKTNKKKYLQLQS